jgi:RNA-directed DNA polymerase
MSAAEKLAGAAPDDAPDWHSIDWKKVYRNVRRLQARIVKALREGRWGKVQALVYLLTHSYSGRALAILRVTTNQGATTPGVDGVLWNTPELKSQAFHALRAHGYSSQPLRRVYILKSNGKQRPLGIPTMIDRAMQALYLLGLDPIVETTADTNSYGFRRERCCADALSQCHNLLCKRNSPAWVLEGDIKSCFDRISHDWLLEHVSMDKSILRQWLKAGFLEKRVWHASTEGTPQGGITSPALANAALDGLEGLLRQRYGATRTARERHQVHLVRYADDFIITGSSRTLLEHGVRPLVEQFLRQRGLELSHEKTTITHIQDGFDFLGQNVRRYPSGKVLLKPSRKNVRAFKAKVRETFREEGGHSTAGQLIQRLNAQIVGWALYHRHASSKRTFSQIDDWVYQRLWRWARRRHRNKSAHWVKKKYFKQVGTRSEVFVGTVYDRDGKAYPIGLKKAGSVQIRRHARIRSEANPYDPAWEPYFEERLQAKMAETLTGKWCVRSLWGEQGGNCPVCGQKLTEEDGWQMHHLRWRVHGGDDNLDNLVLLHPNCHRQVHSQGMVVKKSASREGRS